VKILLVDGAPFYGGQARHVYDLARGLGARGHRVSVACRHPQLEEVLKTAGVECHRLPFRAGVDVLSIRMLHNIIKNERFEVVHTHGVRAGLVGRLAAKIDGGPVMVHTCHTMAEDLVRGKGALARIKKSIYSISEAKLSSFTGKVVTVSDDLKRRSMDCGIAGRKLVTIHSGVDLSQYDILEDKRHARGHIGVPKECRLVGTVARFTPQKNLLDFIRAAKIISRDHDDVMFALVGDGPENENLKLECQRLGIAHKTVFTGFCRDISKILPSFDVFMLSSLWEGHPLSVLEAMAAGVPVVATRVTGIAETIVEGETGYTADVSDVEGLADASMRLLSLPPEKLYGMGQAGRDKAIREFGLDRMISEIEQIYIELTEHGLYRQIAEVF
jgi:glycosyltransferase involved in cell wall biosynthesis